MIREREAYRVKTFMDMIDHKQKTLVFCATQEHAGIIRDLINQVKTSTNPDYCVRVTANDGAIGDQFLRTFQDNDKTIPTVLTTSQKLSTGVDARNVRNIVLLRPINSMIEFKQIIGRGTRLHNEDELRRMWSTPETRKRLLDGLEERGFSRDQLNGIRTVIDAEASDLFDVLAYVAYVRPPETREDRVAMRRSAILDGLSDGQREFLAFVLSQYVSEGEDELDPEKLPGLLNVKYGSASDGLRRLGSSVREVQAAFRGFQEKLYAEEPKH